jgi:hypothetical protein
MGWDRTLVLSITFIALVADGEASAQRRFDPSLIAPPPLRVCTPYATGAIQHAVHVGADVIAFDRALDPIATTGYDGNDTTHVIELRRVADLQLVWARVLDSPPTALAVSLDARRLVIGTYAGATVLDATLGTVIAHTTGAVLALAFGPAGELAVAHDNVVDVLDAAGAPLRTIPITGLAPTVVHAMYADGDCHELTMDEPARARVLAFARDGTLVASVDDGSVRVLGTTDALRWTRPSDRSPGYASLAVALDPSEHAVRASYDDGFVATLRLSTMTTAGTRETHGSGCSRAELAIARRRLGDAAEGEPPRCATRSEDVDGRGRRLSLDAVTIVRDAHGADLLVAPTLHTDAGLLVGDEAWLFGIDGTVERWSLGASGGTYGGGVAIPGQHGVVLDVSDDGRWVAIGMPQSQSHGSEDVAGYRVGIVDTRTETRLASIDTIGVRARFVSGPRVVLEARDASGDAIIEVRSLPDGAITSRVTLAHLEYGGLVAADARWLVLAEDSHVRVQSMLDGSERTIDLPPCAIEAGSLVGDRIAMRVYDRTTTEIGHHRIEVLDLSPGPLRSIASARGASGHDVALVDGGAAAVYAAADGSPTRLDLATGTTAPLAAVTGPILGLASTRGGWLSAQRSTIAMHLVLGAIDSGTVLLDWTRAVDHAGAAIAYELGGTAYVIGHDGRTRAVIEALDGGVVIRSVSGAFGATPEARAALRVRDGDVLGACDAGMEPLHVPGLLEALLE